MSISWKKFWHWLKPQLLQEPLKKAANLATVIGVVIAIVGLISSNRHTVLQLELATRPYLYVINSAWNEVSVVSGDVGTQTRFTIKNFGERPARNVRIKKDFMIRITAPGDKEHLEKMRVRSGPFNPDQEAFWNNYILYRETPVREMAQFFRTQWHHQQEKEIEAQFNAKWQQEGKNYRCEVYGPVESRYQSEPWVIASESYEILTGRSTGKSKDVFTQSGGDILFSYIILEYQGLLKKRNNYELHYIGYFDTARPWQITNNILSLNRYATWDDLDLKK